LDPAGRDLLVRTRLGQPLLRQHAHNGGGERRLAVIDVSDRSDIDDRFAGVDGDLLILRRHSAPWPEVPGPDRSLFKRAGVMKIGQQDSIAADPSHGRAAKTKTLARQERTIRNASGWK